MIFFFQILSFFMYICKKMSEGEKCSIHSVLKRLSVEKKYVVMANKIISILSFSKLNVFVRNFIN